MRTAQISFLLGLLLPLCAVATDFGAKVPGHAAQKQGKCPEQRYYIKVSDPDIKHNICENDDFKCKDNMKCCSDNGDMMCKPPAQDKAGQCPTFNSAPNPAPRCNDNCTSDSECPGNLKCCFKSCGKTCVQSLSDMGNPSTANTERNGFCQQEAVYKCGAKERFFCDEASCINGYKCCPYICRIECRPSIPERDGTCPADADCPSQAENNCSSDYDCPTFHKCCSTKCGKRCLHVTNVHMNIHYPNNKPIV